jgi:glycerol-3-phosphate dehydrogenase
VLSVFGGKITIFRKLAEHALEKLAPYFPGLKPAWTAGAQLPGSDFGSVPRERVRDQFFARYPRIGRETLRGIFRRHGARAAEVAGDGNLGEHFGAGLHERELRYVAEREWAQTSEDVLWRRTKAGLHMSAAQRARVADFMGHA